MTTSIALRVQPIKYHVCPAAVKARSAKEGLMLEASDLLCAFCAAQVFLLFALGVLGDGVHAVFLRFAFTISKVFLKFKLKCRNCDANFALQF